MAAPVRVLIVSTHPVQYAAPLFRLYAQNRDLDVKVAFFSLQGAEPGMDPEFGVEVSWDIPLLDGYSWVHVRNVSPWPDLSRFWGLLNPGIWRLIRGRSFDVVICYGYRAASFWMAMGAAKISRAKLVLSTDAHSLESRGGSRLRRRLKRLVLPNLLGRADAVFAPSNRTVAFLKSLGGVAESDIYLIPNVVDNAFFANASETVSAALVRKSWGAPEGSLVVIFSGKLAPWKRPNDLLEAVARDDRIFAVFAGDGSLRRELELRAGRPDLRGRVRFLGFVNQSELPAVYAAGDVLVLPSEYEPFGLVVNEAFASGIAAVVSSACGSAGDLVQDGETGYVFPPGDVNTLAQRLTWLAEDRALKERLSANARCRIAEWGPEENAGAFAEACLQLAQDR